MRFVLRRSGFFLLTLWVALTLNFLLPRLMPGNPALAAIANHKGVLSPQALKALEAQFGLNDPPERSWRSTSSTSATRPPATGASR